MTPTDHRHDEHLYHGHELHNAEVAHEHSDVNVRALLWSMVIMFGVAIVCGGIVYGMFGLFLRQAEANEPVATPHVVPAGQRPPEPRLLDNEPAYLRQFSDQVAERLKGIDEAKKQLLQQGLPVRADAPSEPWLGTRTAARGESSSGRAIRVKTGGGQ